MAAGGNISGLALGSNTFSNLRKNRAQMLEDSTDLERIYADAARQGATLAPADPEAEVNYHYVCFNKGFRDDVLYEHDGDRDGPVMRRILRGHVDNIAIDSVMDIVQKYIAQLGFSSIEFSLLALSNTI
ncbi:ubiquitinyl hydrolase 1 [Friedmanniomyces endolithicus]|uniref:ubiquitinyl hydrolase 1 n=1 Tax=Friedmanniomyces endolithicus TaxID=329885 RepID=A0AAN6H4S5_9PEZI|nr:ubiquitinyl hydrolase 1 [Friedmanniomyces endolithicus]KAK0950558.1 ubiquitinyl hydrolase 1 [Friedmanniomyces endolithicus]KAK0951678.1 ubiquitinyl hydrolase 1 [Friedmanniomyces endolithicus]KAK1022036.1 ubiquitinyl hydrolase 1 [Friedmanniomyces endolithicus]